MPEIEEWSNLKLYETVSVSGGDLGIFGDLVMADSNLWKGYSGFFRSIKKPDGPISFQYEDPLPRTAGQP